MTTVLEIDHGGKHYVFFHKLAADTGYDREYLRKLAKNGKVDAIQLGESWFIEANALEGYQGERGNRGPHRVGVSPERNTDLENAKITMIAAIEEAGSRVQVRQFLPSVATGFNAEIEASSGEDWLSVASALEDQGIKTLIAAPRPTVGERVAYEIEVIVPLNWRYRGERHQVSTSAAAE